VRAMLSYYQASREGDESQTCGLRATHVALGIMWRSPNVSDCNGLCAWERVLSLRLGLLRVDRCARGRLTIEMHLCLLPNATSLGVSSAFGTLRACVRSLRACSSSHRRVAEHFHEPFVHLVIEASPRRR
jgi:hypothetical protein